MQLNSIERCTKSYLRWLGHSHRPATFKLSIASRRCTELHRLLSVSRPSSRETDKDLISGASVPKICEDEIR